MPEASALRIIVFRTGQLGDTLVSVPALKMIRKQYPHSQISWLYDCHVGKRYVMSRSLLEGSGMVDRFLSYPVGYRLGERVRAMAGVLLLWMKLRLQTYDLVVHLEPEMKISARSRRDYWFFRTAGVKRQIQTLRYRIPGLREKGSALPNEVDFFLEALSQEGLKALPEAEPCMDLATGETEQMEVETWRASAKPPQTRTCIAVGLGSKMQSKRWPEERFQAVLASLVSERDVWPVFYGGPEDSEQAEALIRKVGAGSNACGALSLRASAASMQACRFYLGNDTGTMHLAVAAGIPCVAIFSARDVPGKWYPYGKGHIVHRIPVSCQGCMLYECTEEGRRCLMAITAEEILTSCRMVLERESDDVPLTEVTDGERREFSYPQVTLASL